MPLLIIPISKDKIYKLAQFSYIISENCPTNKIKKTTLSYNFDIAQVFNISL